MILLAPSAGEEFPIGLLAPSGGEEFPIGLLAPSGGEDEGEGGYAGFHAHGPVTSAGSVRSLSPVEGRADGA